MRNWRGEKQRTTVFNTDRPTTIAGGNGVGKSRHFDAFFWLLFGKDRLERKDFHLRTYDENHNVLHRCECSVEAVLVIDGIEITIKREFAEQWVKPRGQVEEVFKGNVTECTWDGVPVKVSDFQKRISENIIDETLFKMLTNPHYFTEEMKWQQQREVLLQMAGVKSDDELADGRSDFRTLLDSLNGKPLVDFRKELAAEKKRLKDDLAEVQPRIDQTRKMMPESENWSELERQITSTKLEIDSLTRQIQDEEKRDIAARKLDRADDEELYSLSVKLQDAKRAALESKRKEAEEKNTARRDIEARLKEVHAELTDLNIDTTRVKKRKANLEEQVVSIEKQLGTLRDEWYTLNASTYTGEETCPHCGQTLPKDKIAQARQMFDKDKAERLRMNNERGKNLVQEQTEYRKEIDANADELRTIESKIKLRQEESDQLYKRLDALPSVSIPTDITEPTIEMEAIARQIEEVKARKQARESSSDIEKLKKLESKRDLLSDGLTDITERLLKRDQIERATEEIKRLEKQGRDIAQRIADVERREFVAVEFSKKKVEDCEHRINSLFSRVTFQLFGYTQEGSEFETCIPLVDGVPYPVANTASQMNAGLDIIGTLCRFNNICAPIFIDGAESVNEYIEVPSQVVFLRVTEDKSLIIK